MTGIRNVGEMLEALRGLAPETPLMFQVVAKDGSAWLMNGSAGPVKHKADMWVIQLKHPSIKSLPPCVLDEEALAAIDHQVALIHQRIESALKHYLVAVHGLGDDSYREVEALVEDWSTMIQLVVMRETAKGGR